MFVRTSVLALALASCGGHPAPPRSSPCTPTALTAPGWAGKNAADLTRWLDAKGCASPTFEPANRPIALFDWDNTIVKNDVGDAVTLYALAHDQILQPPNKDWKQTSAFLTDAAAQALSAACGTDVAPGRPLPTSKNLKCADEILTIYDDEKTTGGAPAFGSYHHRRIEPAYAWTAQLLAGHTPDELREITLAAVEPQLTAPEGATQTVGTHEGQQAWIRFYEPQRDLIAALSSRGFDVWVITASPQIVIQTLASRVGVAPDHVIGIRPIIDHGKITAHLEGCGPVADGEDALIPYVEGKRCWVNKVVFGDRSAKAIERRPDGARQTFAAGDSDSDTEFVRDADYKLVIDRHKAALMCLALHDERDSWRVNPMFLEPMPAQVEPYPCSTTACKDDQGNAVPCTDDAGQVIPDQPASAPR